MILHDLTPQVYLPDDDSWQLQTSLQAFDTEFEDLQVFYKCLNANALRVTGVNVFCL
jgi:hypothetical protein